MPEVFLPVKTGQKTLYFLPFFLMSILVSADDQNTAKQQRIHCEQAVRLGGRHNIPPPRHLDFWPFDLEVGVGVACDLG